MQSAQPRCIFRRHTLPAPDSAFARGCLCRPPARTSLLRRLAEANRLSWLRLEVR
jgi:hypothetical protein